MSGRKIQARVVFEAFLIRNHRKEMKNILEEKDEQLHYSLEINFLAFSEEHIEVAEAILASPVKMMYVFDSAFIKALTQIYEEEKTSNEHLSLKLKVHVRLIGLPRYPELYRHAIPHSSDVGRILCITGTVVRTVSPRMLEYQREYICMKCKHVFVVKADYSLFYQLNKPLRCLNPTTCYSTNFRLNESEKFLHTKDYQEIKIQEQAQKLLVGTIPRSIWVTLEDDLVDVVKPGDDVLICGIVLQRWQSVVKGSRPSIDLVIKANNITVSNKQKIGSVVTNELKAEFVEFWQNYRRNPLAARNVILSSFCPQVYGLYVVKLAVAVVIAGGVQKIDVSGTRTRGESHLLLVGDPGTGKSQFLKYVSNLVPRCVLTTGIGTTSAGLTVAAVREEGEWALEAGALVLADGGVCCIDEFNCIREMDRAAIHEAMEQQTISVAKAGIVCKLNTRCNILAATNPKGRYDTAESVNINVALASPLLSRFDIILVLLDSRNSEWDRVVSSYILEGKNPLSSVCAEIDGDLWSLERLQAYFCFIKTLQPRMSKNAHAIFTKYYQLQRQTDEQNQARTTIRLLESLVRLSQGHARLMMRDEVETIDAIVAVTLIEASMHGTSLLPSGNALHTAFPTSPKEEYRKQVKVILQKLGLLEILTTEINRLNQEADPSCSQPVCKEHPQKGGSQNTRVQMPFITQYKPLLRGLAQTQDKNYFSNILEMNDCFSAEEKTAIVTKGMKVSRKKRNINRLSSESDSCDNESAKNDSGSFDVSFGGLSTKRSTLEKDHHLRSGKRKSKTETSLWKLRKYSRRSELKRSKTKYLVETSEQKPMNKSSTSENQAGNLRLGEATVKGPANCNGESPLTNSTFDQSLDQLSQDLFDLDDFDESRFYNCEPDSGKGVKSSRVSMNVRKNTQKSVPLNKKLKSIKPPKELNLNEASSCTVENSLLEKKRITVTQDADSSKEVSVVSLKGEFEDYSKPKEEKEVEESLLIYPPSNSAVSSTDNLPKKLNLQRFAFTRTSSRTFGHEKEQIPDCPHQNNSHENITPPFSQDDETSSLRYSSDVSSAFLENKDITSPTTKSPTNDSSFLEKLKKFNFQKSTANSTNGWSFTESRQSKEKEKTSLEKEPMNILSEISNGYTPLPSPVLSSFKKALVKQISQGSSLSCSQVSQKSFNRDQIASIFDKVDENVDFDL